MTYSSYGTFGQTILQPWKCSEEFQNAYTKDMRVRTVVSPDRVWTIYAALKHTLKIKGDVWECGVFKGGTAMFIAAILNGKRKVFRLFDTFEGMPPCNVENGDDHKEGDFNNTSLADVKQMLEQYDFIEYHKGLMPSTFAPAQNSIISFAHIDVDIYQSVSDCCEFVWPRLAVGGTIVFDDYGFSTTRGACKAVDEYFHDKDAFPLFIPTGQALVYKAHE